MTLWSYVSVEPSRWEKEVVLEHPEEKQLLVVAVSAFVVGSQPSHLSLMSQIHDSARFCASGSFNSKKGERNSVYVWDIHSELDSQIPPLDVGTPVQPSGFRFVREFYFGHLMQPFSRSEGAFGSMY